MFSLIFFLFFFNFLIYFFSKRNFFFGFPFPFFFFIFFNKKKKKKKKIWSFTVCQRSNHLMTFKQKVILILSFMRNICGKSRAFLRRTISFPGIFIHGYGLGKSLVLRAISFELSSIRSAVYFRIPTVFSISKSRRFQGYFQHHVYFNLKLPKVFFVSFWRFGNTNNRRWSLLMIFPCLAFEDKKNFKN